MLVRIGIAEFKQILEWRGRGSTIFDILAYPVDPKQRPFSRSLLAPADPLSQEATTSLRRTYYTIETRFLHRFVLLLWSQTAQRR